VLVDAGGLFGERLFQPRYRARTRSVKPMAKEIPADHQVFSPAA
jgi:hypothetical protein